MADLFKDVLPSLNIKTAHLIDNGELPEKDFNAYIINKAFSYGLDTVLFANEMNKKHFMDKKLQYDFYFYGLDKKKRFNKWLKPEVINNLDTIKEYYGCGNKEAKQYAKVLTPDQIQTIEKRIYKGEVQKE